jgi:ABC-type multidrug transport system ATPase subunit
MGSTRFLAGILFIAILNLRVERGQIVGLLGESGSGKTTLLREMLGLWLPSAGSIHLFGFDLRDPDVMEQRHSPPTWHVVPAWRLVFGIVSVR